MLAATRLGDVCTGHDACPSRPSIEGSPNVLVNGIPWHRQGDAWAVHGCKKHLPHGAVLAKGSATVLVNGRQAGRVTDPVSCGSFVATGSPNVFAEE